jgi:hypothetical protein
MNNQDDITKKDHTYDHEGNLIEVKQVKTNHLPHISY